MLTVADMGEGGVKNGQKSADILYGRPLLSNLTLGTVCNVTSTKVATRVP